MNFIHIDNKKPLEYLRTQFRTFERYYSGKQELEEEDGREQMGTEQDFATVQLRSNECLSQSMTVRMKMRQRL